MYKYTYIKDVCTVVSTYIIYIPMCIYVMYYTQLCIPYFISHVLDPCIYIHACVYMHVCIYAFMYVHTYGCILHMWTFVQNRPLRLPLKSDLHAPHNQYVITEIRQQGTGLITLPCISRLRPRRQ